MLTNFFIYIPSISQTLEPPLAGKLLGAAMKRFRIMVYISMAVFLISGIWMGSLHLDSGAMQSSRNQMIAVLLFKVPLYIVMVVLAIAAFEFVAPRVARMAAEGSSPELQKVQRIQKILAMTGFILGVIVLALSAML
jgi:uncharacterized membrane protein